MDQSGGTSPEGNDQITLLGVEFNQMAGSLTKLLADVRREQARLENIMNGVGDGLYRGGCSRCDPRQAHAGAAGRVTRDDPAPLGSADRPPLPSFGDPRGAAARRVILGLAPTTSATLNAS